MTLRETFEQILSEKPSDTATRNAFADWCSDNGLDELSQFHREWTEVKQAFHESEMTALAKMIEEADLEPFTAAELMAVCEKYETKGDMTTVGDTGFGAEGLFYGEDSRANRVRLWSAYFFLKGRPFNPETPDEELPGSDGQPFSCC